MPNFKEQQSKAKSSISHCLNKTKEFCDNHKKMILLGSYAILATGLGITTFKMQKYKNYLHIERTEWDNSKHVINSLNERIIYLENLSEIKDNLFNRAISNDFRHGGSFGAQQMAYRKAYLNSCNKAVDLQC